MGNTAARYNVGPMFNAGMASIFIGAFCARLAYPLVVSFLSPLFVFGAKIKRKKGALLLAMFIMASHHTNSKFVYFLRT